MSIVSDLIPLQPSNGVHRRIVAVQGSAQLTSALAAMRTMDRVHQPKVIQNYLIVHDLSAPEEQSHGFASALRDLSSHAAEWSSVRYVTDTDLTQLDQTLMRGGWSHACQSLRETLKITCCDQLLLGQNLLFINKLLHETYPSAETACYGDGIGLNFTPDYYNPKSSLRGWRGFERRLKTKLRSLLRKISQRSKNRPHLKENAVDFNKYFLLVANGFDQQLSQFEQLEAGDFVDLFAIFSTSLPRYAKSTCDELTAALSEAEQVVFLLTSNFSETKRMTLESELQCCLDQVKQQCRSDHALLIIKPHPRDSDAKIIALKAEALKHFKSVVALTDKWTFFIPFEAIFARFIASDSRIASRTTVVCSSSACVSLELLYGQRCELGFGADNVTNHFSLAWRELRQRHEADLRHLLSRIRFQLQCKKENAEAWSCTKGRLT